MLDTTPATAVTQVLTDLNTALSKADPAAAAALFETEGCWRDLASLTWNIKTMEGPDEIAAMLAAQMAQIKPRGFTITPGELAEDTGSFQQAWIDFETETGRGHGHIRIRDGKIWTLLTTLKELNWDFGASKCEHTWSDGALLIAFYSEFHQISSRTRPDSFKRDSPGREIEGGRGLPSHVVVRQ